MRNIKNEYWQGRKLIAYVIGREYETWEKGNKREEVSFDEVINTDIDEQISDAVIVVFSLDTNVFNEVRESYSSLQKQVTVITYDDFFYSTKERLGGSIIREIITDDSYSANTYYTVIKYGIDDAINLFPYISAVKSLHNNPAQFGLENLDFWYKKRRIHRIVALTSETLVKTCRLCDEIDEIREYSEFELDAINRYLYNHALVENIFPDKNIVYKNHETLFVGSKYLYPYALYDLPENNELLSEYIDNYRLRYSSEG